MDKGKRCNKHNPVFRQLDTGENIGLGWGLQMQCNQRGVKAVNNL